jgi:hypothetical protein
LRLITRSFPKALKRVLYRELLCLERSPDGTPGLFAPRIDPVPTLRSFIDVTKEHPNVRRYGTHDPSIRARYLRNRAHTPPSIWALLREPSLVPTARIADALSVTRTTLLIESTLNVGSDSCLSTVGLGTREEHGCRRRSVSQAILAGA